MAGATREFDRGTHQLIIALGLLLALGDSCAAGPPLPAYAHNDYQNPRPLLDALELGYQGVEADFFLIDGQLLVAHDRDRTRAGRTLEAVYLRPLRERLERCGAILAGRPFLLNLEAKTRGGPAYGAVRELLSRYRDLLTTVVGGVERPGPVQIVLVGWHPPLDSLAREAERFVAVQWRLTPRGADPPDVPAHLVRLVTLDFGSVASWSGAGPPPDRAVNMLARLKRVREASPGRIARVHNAAADARVYRLILDAGADLIGTKTLRQTSRLLAPHP